MKKIIFITSYCNTQDKLDVLNLNLELLGSTGIDVFLYSPIELPIEVTKKTKYYFQNCESQKEDNYVNFWVADKYCGHKIKLNRLWKDTLNSGFNQTKFLINLSKSFDYDMNYFLLYDLVLTNEILDLISHTNDENFFPFVAYDHGHKKQKNCSTQIFSVSKQKLNQLNSLFTWNECIKFNSAEDFFYDISKKLQIKIHETILVEDHISTFNKWTLTFFNFSPWQDFKIFFSKNLDNDENSNIIFYDVKSSTDLFLRIDNKIEKININNLHTIKIHSETKIFEVWYEGKIFDVLKKFSDVLSSSWELID